MLNYLALLGWSPGDDREIMTTDELVAAFTLDRVQKTPARFDPDKLDWMNAEYMKTLPIDRLEALHDAYLEVADSPAAGLDPARRRLLISMYRPRATTFADIDRQAAFFFERPTEWSPKTVKKHLQKGGGWDRLEALRDVVADIDDWTEQGIETALRSAADDLADGKLGKIAQPLRIALTGTGVSPGIWETVAFFDQTEVVARIEACLASRES